MTIYHSFFDKLTVCVCFKGSHCEHKINPCNSNPCLNGGACNHVNHTFSCTCSEGFTGIYCQETQDTCDKCFNKGQCAETTDGDKICFCPKGIITKKKFFLQILLNYF